MHNASMGKKTCKKCGEEKPASQFYKHPRSADGLDCSCKECRKKAVRENRRKNAEYYREYDAMRFRRDQHRRDAIKAYAKTKAGRESHKKASAKWRSANPEKRAAHVILGNRLRDGKITKPDKCQECGATGRIHGHHEDYSKPLEVDWLCPSCHAKRHHGE